MPSPSAIWVCDRPSCWRIRRKRGPTNSFFPLSLGMAVSLTYFVTKLTNDNLHRNVCYIASPIEIKLTVLIAWIRVYLPPCISQCIVKNVETGDTVLQVRRRKDYEHELPATRDWRTGSPGPGVVSEPDRGGPGAPRRPADLERGEGRGRRADAPAEPLQDRPRHRPLHRGADAGGHGRL